MDVVVGVGVHYKYKLCDISGSDKHNLTIFYLNIASSSRWEQLWFNSGLVILI